jgi:hypothetical protein
VDKSQPAICALCPVLSRNKYKKKGGKGEKNNAKKGEGRGKKNQSCCLAFNFSILILEIQTRKPQKKGKALGLLSKPYQDCGISLTVHSRWVWTEVPQMKKVLPAIYADPK